MELQPYGPMEEATSQFSPSALAIVKKSNNFWWGVLAATAIYGLVLWVASVDYKVIRRDKEPNRSA